MPTLRTDRVVQTHERGSAPTSTSSRRSAICGNLLRLLGAVTAAGLVTWLLVTSATVSTPSAMSAPTVKGIGTGAAIVTAVITHRDNVVIVAQAGYHLIHLSTAEAPHLQTSNGRPIAPSDVRVGDSLVPRARGRIADGSQFQASLSGTIVDSPDPQGGPMVVDLHNGTTTVIDVGARTLLRSTSHRKLVVADLQQSERVRVTGVFDRRTREMVQTALIIEQDPVRR